MSLLCLAGCLLETLSYGQPFTRVSLPPGNVVYVCPRGVCRRASWRWVRPLPLGLGQCWPEVDQVIIRPTACLCAFVETRGGGDSLSRRQPSTDRLTNYVKICRRTRSRCVRHTEGHVRHTRTQTHARTQSHRHTHPHVACLINKVLTEPAARKPPRAQGLTTPACRQRRRWRRTRR
jgi:hypothetical protein